MAVKKEKKFVITDPESPMSKGQSYALYSVTGVDVRNLDLTKGAASKLIDGANSGSCKEVRVALTNAGGEVKTRDVHKNFRKETNPTGYKPKAAPKAKTTKKAAPESEDVGLTVDALKRLATDNPDQLIALLTGKPLPSPEPKPKGKTQSNKKPPVKKDEQNVSGDMAEELAKLLAS